MKSIFSKHPARSGPSDARQRSRGQCLVRGVAMTGTLALLSGCALTSSIEGYSATDPVELRYADYAPATASGPFDAFAAQLGETTEGRVQTDPYWGGSLLSDKDLPSGLRAGIADIGIFTATQHPEYAVPSWMSNTASLGTTDFPEGILQTYAGFADYAYNSEAINRQFEELGLKLLVPLHTILNYNLICTQPVESLEDAQGLRVRSGGPLWNGEISAAGMIPVNLPIGEVYEGLQRGVVDCTIANPRTAMTYGFWEIAKFYTEVPFSGVNSQYVVMNQSTWDSLSEDDQDALWDAGQTLWAENLQQDALQEYLKFFEVAEDEQGVSILEADPELTDAITDYQEAVIEGLPEDAPPSIDDPEGEIKDYSGSLDRWLADVEGMDLGDDPSNPDLSEYFERTKTDIWDKVDHESSH